ncbi:MAG: AI-2E family transporter [Clostridia bacterium]|nr:AI-2E family transporter [[Bacteroides] pectinophilus]MDD5872515.1 AI-2E family transporter [Clostridia bacterium]
MLKRLQMVEPVNRDIRNKLILIGGSAGISVAVFVGVRYILPITAPFVLAFFLSVLLENKVTALADIAHGRVFRGNKTAAAIVIVTILTAVVIAVLGALGYFAMSEIRGLVSNYDYYCAVCDAQVAQACERMDGWLGLEIGRMYGVVCNGVDSLKKSFDGGKMASAMGTSFAYASFAMKKILLWAGAFFMLIISTVYMSRDMNSYRQWKKNTRFREEADVLWSALAKLGNVYFKTQLIIICCTAAVCTVGLLVIGNPYAVVIGITIGLLDALPFFGTGTVLIPWSIIAVLAGNVWHAAVLMTVYVITYFEREILESKLMGKGLDISPVTMMAAIYTGLLVYGFWGFVLGPVSYCLIKGGIQLLKCQIERDKIINKKL